MHLSIKPMNKKANLKSCLLFQQDAVSAYWREPLFSTYTFLDKEKGLNSDWKSRKKYITEELSRLYTNTKSELLDKSKFFQTIWNNHEVKVNEIFSQTFKIDCHNLFNDLKADISLNPICPRWLKLKYFTVFYQSNETKFMETSIHEIIHFVWFYIWNQTFKDDYKDYENPNLKWVLSEMVVDTFVKNTDIGHLFLKKNHNNTVYSYFYRMIINEVPILETLSQIYKNSTDIPQFMQKAYEYCLDNETAIRKQML